MYTQTNIPLIYLQHFLAEHLRTNDYPDISILHAYSMKGYTANTPIGQMVNFLNYGSKHGDVESLKV